jgi:hypothetical protein
MLLSPSLNGIFSYLKHYWSVVIKLSNYPIDKQVIPVIISGSLWSVEVEF